MRSRTILYCILLCSLPLILLTVIPCRAGNISVTSLKDDGTGGCTLREAVAAANTSIAVGGCPAGSGDFNVITFTVAGTVQLTDYIDVTKSVTIKGIEMPGLPLSPSRNTIKAAPGSPTILFSGGGTPQNYELMNLTLAGPDSDDGYGVVLSAGDSLNIADCVLKGFHSSYGSAVSNFGGVFRATNSVFSGNSATGSSGYGPNGGAIFSTSYTELNNCTITGNYAAGQGGGIYATDRTHLYGCTFAGNRAGTSGGGISLTSATRPKSIIDSIFWGDAAPVDPEIANTGSALPVTYSDMAGASAWTGTGNILGDPAFILPRPASEAPTSAGNYHLKHTSPCINAGTVNGDTADIDFDARGQDGAYDIGSDEAGPPFNDSFEYGAAIPGAWKAGSLTADDKRVKSSRHLGAWSFKFTGGSAGKYLKQTINLAGAQNGQIYVSCWSKAQGASASGGAYRLEAKLYYDGGTTGRILVPFPTGTHAWQYRRKIFTTQKAFHKIDLFVRYADQTGTAWFDDVKLLVVN